MGKMHVTVAFFGFLSLTAGDKAGHRPDHAVAPERDIDTLDVVADVGMRACEIGEHDVGPLGLPGARRLMDSFSIETAPGRGTTIVMTRRVGGGAVR